MMTRKTGVTLIEMLVVIAVIAIVAGMSVVAFAPFLRGRTLSRAVSTIQAGVWEAKGHAAARRTKATLYFDADNRAVLLFEDPAFVHKADEEVSEEKEKGHVSAPEFLPEGIFFAEIQNASAENPVVILEKEDDGTFTRPLQVKHDPANPEVAKSQQRDTLVFNPGGSLDYGRMILTGPWYVVLEDGKGRRVVIEFLFATGLTRTHEL